MEPEPDTPRGERSGAPGRWEVADYWHAVANARDWVGTSQPWNRFVGWEGWGLAGEPGANGGMSSLPEAWSVPTAAEVGPRISQNLTHYLTNYAVVSLVAMVYMVVSHPRLLLWLAALALLYMGTVKAWENRHRIALRLGVPLPQVQLPLKPQHSTLLFSIVGTVLVFITIGHDVFVFIGITSSVVMSHAVFRVPLSDHEAKLGVDSLLGSNNDEGDGRQDTEDVPATV